MEVFDKLHSSLTSKTALLLTFQTQIEKHIESVAVQIELLVNQKPQWGAFASQFDMFIDVFGLYQQQLIQESQSFLAMKHTINENMLVKL